MDNILSTRKGLIRDVIESVPNRRKFLQKLGLASAAGAALLSGERPAWAQTITDTDILNFALNLEYLEAEFYTVATTGLTIQQVGIGVTGVGTQGATYGGQKVSLSNEADPGKPGNGRGQGHGYANGLPDCLVYTKDVVLELAYDEQTHVTLLRSALGSAAIAKPAINLNALGFGFNNSRDFLILARAFEDVGVSAYAGAAPLITSKAILGTAARILGAEAEHTGNIRLQVAILGIPTTALDGVDILPPPSGSKFFSLNSSALVQVRTPGQVLYIVYGFAANVTSGGFFPNGVNGTINMSSTPA